MVIQSKIPVCEYWNFQLENNWMESLDYRFYPIHLNSHTADLDENEFIIHVTHEPIDAKKQYNYMWKRKWCNAFKMDWSRQANNTKCKNCKNRQTK